MRSTSTFLTTVALIALAATTACSTPNEPLAAEDGAHLESAEPDGTVTALKGVFRAPGDLEFSFQFTECPGDSGASPSKGWFRSTPRESRAGATPDDMILGKTGTATYTGIGDDNFGYSLSWGPFSPSGISLTQWSGRIVEDEVITEGPDAMTKVQRLPTSEEIEACTRPALRTTPVR